MTQFACPLSMASVEQLGVQDDTYMLYKLYNLYRFKRHRAESKPILVARLAVSLIFPRGSEQRCAVTVRLFCPVVNLMTYPIRKGHPGRSESMYLLHRSCQIRTWFVFLFTATLCIAPM